MHIRVSLGESALIFVMFFIEGRLNHSCKHQDPSIRTRREKNKLLSESLFGKPVSCSFYLINWDEPVAWFQTVMDETFPNELFLYKNIPLASVTPEIHRRAFQAQGKQSLHVDGKTKH